ncbi:hypothetical protein ZIOFF_039206 [Zingiber officinale]|uniref:Macrophage migration inhibitory factor n=1 Tax=Zingiber officinale TaxID=94328 RepID=A0A8J5L3M1_ZINOF|nr:hypothetical protein ZIOFF_039206 [Zingiber officinale]
MPCLNLSTNIRLEDVDTSAVLSEATKTIADIVGKPESYVMVVLKGSIPILFGGTQQPAAYGELVSIGGLNPDVNKKLSAGISDILENNLPIKHKNMLSVCMPCISNKHVIPQILIIMFGILLYLDSFPVRVQSLGKTLAASASCWTSSPSHVHSNTQAPPTQPRTLHCFWLFQSSCRGMWDDALPTLLLCLVALLDVDVGGGGLRNRHITIAAPESLKLATLSALSEAKVGVVVHQWLHLGLQLIGQCMADMSGDLVPIWDWAMSIERAREDGLLVNWLLHLGLQLIGQCMADMSGDLVPIWDWAMAIERAREDGIFVSCEILWS